MNNPYIIAVMAGLASAIIYASATSGPLPVMVVLNLLAPLPLFLAGLGWSASAGGIAAAVGTLALALIIPKLSIVFALAYAIPAALLAFLALLHRAPQANGAKAEPQSQAAWFPVGRILAVAAALACLFSLAFVRLLGADAHSREQTIRAFLQQGMLKPIEAATGHALSGADIDEFVKFLDYTIPATTAVSWLLLMLFNLWLAGRITLASGTLVRPWPDLAALRLPALFPLVFAGLVGLLFLREPMPLLVSGPIGVCLIAYLLVGLAVLHTITRRNRFRAMLLGVTYTGMLVLPQVFSVLAILIGLGEPLLRLRDRLMPPPRPPAFPPSTPS